MNDEHGTKIQRMFDRISPRYDLLNRILSFGMDLRWRRKGVRRLGNMRGKTVADLCCGSGDFLMILRKLYADEIRLCGVDFAQRMLTLATRRFDRRRLAQPWLCRADVRFLPLVDKSVDAVAMAFGIRNIADKEGCLKDVSRILRAGGQVIIVEPAMPYNPVIKAAFSLYFKHVMPVIGWLISGDYAAYRYLRDSVVAFPEPEQFVSLMSAAGFENVRALRQSFGAAMIYHGQKRTTTDRS